VVIDAHHGIDAPLVIGERMIVKVFERQIGEDGAGGLAVGLTRCGEAGVTVAGLAEICGAEQGFQAAEAGDAVEDARRIDAVGLRRGDWNLVEWSERTHGSFQKAIQLRMTRTTNNTNKTNQDE